MTNHALLRATAIAGTCLAAAWAVGVAPASAADMRNVAARSALAAAGSGATAVTYDPDVAPVGAQLAVAIHTGADGGSSVTLDVEGLLPDRGYAAHAHVNPCGAAGADAGPHFQNTADPAAGPDRPSTDPAYANPQNEVWLDLHTDGNGDGHADADVPFALGDRSPRSVVIHEADATATDAGHAGTAGARAACITLPG